MARYWVGGTNTWNATAGTKWATTSGGAGGASVPTTADDVFFDGNSGSGTITTSGTSTDVCRSLNCTGFTGTLNHAASTRINIGDGTAGAGNVALKLVAGMTYTIASSSDIYLVSTSATQQTIDTGGKSLRQLIIDTSANNSNYILASAMTVRYMAWYDGTFTTNNFNMSIGGSDVLSPASIVFGTSTITFTGENSFYTIKAFGSTLSAASATFVLQNSSPASQRNFAASGTTLGSVTVTGDNLRITNSFTVGTFNLNNAGQTVGLVISSGQTVTVTSAFNSNGTAGNLTKLLSSTSGSAATLSKSSGSVVVDYMSIKDSTATGGASWYAGANSTDVSGNTGWIFDDPYHVGEAHGTLVFSGNATRKLKAAREAKGTLVFDGEALGVLRPDPSIIEKKTYLYKIYDEDNNYLGVWDDVIDPPNWSHELNTTGSTTTVFLARNADSTSVVIEALLDNTGAAIQDNNNFNILTSTESRNKVGPGSNVNHNYRVDIYAYYGETATIDDNLDIPIEDNEGNYLLGTVGSPNGLRRFSGFISEININYGDSENTQVELMSYGFDLDQYLVVNSSDETTVAFNSTDPSDIIMDGLDQFTLDGIDTFTTYATSTIEVTGTTPSYTFRANTYKELLETAVKLAPAGWAYWIGLGDNLVRFQAKPSTAEHTFYLGKHIKNLNLRSYIGDVVNEVIFTGGGDPALFKRYTEAPQVGTRRGLSRLSDNRVELETSADILSEGEIDEKNDIQYRSTVEILDKVYDIESIELGQLIAFRNFDNNVDLITMQVVGYNYTPDSITLALDTLPPTVSKRLEELRKALNAQETETVPVEPDV